MKKTTKTTTTTKTTGAKPAPESKSKPAPKVRYGPLPENRVTSKRMARLSNADRAKALREFEKGAKIADLAKRYAMKESNLRYSILSEKVANGSVPVLDPTDVKALRKAVADEGPASAATRAGISGTKLRELLA